jgi:hypothetical protein
LLPVQLQVRVTFFGEILDRNRKHKASFLGFPGRKSFFPPRWLIGGDEMVVGTKWEHFPLGLTTAPSQHYRACD